MYTITDIQKARVNQSMASKVYKSIFFDESNQPKLRSWLMKSGVPFHHLDEVESLMRNEFANLLGKYSHDKIPFDKFCWTGFKYTLVNWFNSRKIAKNNTVSLNELLDCEDTEFEPEGHSGINIDYDMEPLFTELSPMAGTCARCYYYSDWTDADIKKYFSMENHTLEIIKMEIRSAVRNFQLS